MRALIYKKIKLALLSFGFLALATIAIPDKAQAINNITIQNQAPVFNSANTDSAPDPPDTGYTPWMAVGVGAYDGQFSYAKVYTTQDSTLTITQGACSTVVTSGGFKVAYTVSRLKTVNGTSEKVASQVGTYTRNSTFCSSDNNGKPFTVPLNNGIASGLSGHQGWNTFYVQAQLINPSPGDNEMSFRLSVNNGGQTGLSRPEFCGTSTSPCNPNTDNKDGYFGIYSRNLGPKTAFPVQANMWQYAVQFAPRCGEPTGGTNVGLYDMDPGKYSPQKLKVQIQKDDRNNPGFSWNTIVNKNSFKAGNAQYDKVPFTSNITDRYRLVFSGINWHNSIQITLPFDQFDAQVAIHCYPPLSCNATASPNTVAVAGDPSTVTIVGTGSVSWGPPGSTAYHIKRILASDAPAESNLAITTYQGGSTYTNVVHPQPPSGSSVTYTYAVLDPYNNQVPGATCPVTVWVSPPPLATAKPYFQVWQNDAAAGGGFKTDDIACPGSSGASYPTNTGYVSPTTTGNNYRGGIIANSANGSPYQSMSDFGAVALGRISISPGSDEGFYADLDATASLRTWFANTAGNEGHLNSSNPYRCVKDFYTDTKISPNPPNITNLAAATNPLNCPADAAGKHSCQFKWTGGPDLAGIISFPSHYQITIYVDSDITIDSNISYSTSFDPRDPTDVPYFSLIVQGNITLKNAVTQLDGLYVAQPTPNHLGGINANTGVFKTCDIDPCNNQVVVNGAVIAQHVRLLRAHGSSKILIPDTWRVGNAPAEIFNFVPSMVLGTPAFAPFCQPASACTQSSYSIAPVF